MRRKSSVMSESQFEQFVLGAAGETRIANGELAYEPEVDDLYFLYSEVREKACLSVLEFGSGWSTFALAQALTENQAMMSALYSVRHPNAFQMMTIDASADWLEIAVNRLTPEQRRLVRPVATTPRLYDYFGTYATLYDDIPSFAPDLIYLDGPDPEQVEGTVDGFKLAETHGLPMNADLLRMENHFWPGTMIITDGRTSNARFLANRFTRNWESLHDPFGDRTIFRLAETPLGQISEQHYAFRLQAARELRNKEGPTL